MRPCLHGSCTTTIDCIREKPGAFYDTVLMVVARREKKKTLDTCGQRMPRSVYADAQTDQGRRCLLTESAGIIECIDVIRLCSFVGLSGFIFFKCITTTPYFVARISRLNAAKKPQRQLSTG